MIKQIVKLIFNYYIVLKACWAIVLFQVLGYFALVVFDQGQDIIQGLSLNGDGVVIRHTIFALISLFFWSWQSWRASRVLLHLSYFNFWSYQPHYALRAQVLIPRLLALTPFVIFAIAAYEAKKGMDILAIASLSIGIWFVVFLHFRRAIIVWIRAKGPHFYHVVPDYIPIKNGAYPVSFIWKKQRRWLMFRLFIVALTFIMMTLFPISVSQYLGSLAVVLSGFGTWLILASVVNFAEMRLHFPVAITLALMVIFFSYFNNNHRVRLLKTKPKPRPDVQDAFKEWVKDKDTSKQIPVILVAAEGGGIRAAYWTSSILGSLENEMPGFSNNIFTYSSVSGGSLGVALHNASLLTGDKDLLEKNREILANDFLAPVTSYLIYPDMLQKFIPVKIPRFDRAKILEKSWEQAWNEIYTDHEGLLDSGFVSTFSGRHLPHLILNGTHVESGYRTVISDMNLSNGPKKNLFDLIDITNRDLAISTAIGLSARFPYLTPPALVPDSTGKPWGDVVDGGYYENLGATTLFEVYQELREYCHKHDINVRFHLVMIRNTKSNRNMGPIRGLYEFQSPFRTLANIWGNNGDDVIRSMEDYVASNNDRIVVVKLTRDDNINIPLGWYLSPKSRKQVDNLLNEIEPTLQDEILTYLK